MRLGAHDAARLRRTRDRPTLGAAPPGARPGRTRGAPAPQLAAGVEQDPQHARLRRGLRGQGVRQRVLRGSLPIVAGGDGGGGGVEGRLAGGGAQGARRAHVPRDAHPHLRRRHQRGAARHHRDGRPRHAAGALKMDFALSPEQEALRDLARRILADHVTPERLALVEAEPDRFDRAAWEALAGARLLGTAIPEEFGGSGLGVLELCLLLEEVGRAVAPLPAWPTLVLGALPLARFGTREQRAAFLPGVASGEVVLTAALLEPDGDDPLHPATAARRDGARWRLDGTKTCVPAAHLAARVLVPARTAPGEAAHFLVDPRGAGVRVGRPA